MAVTKLLHLKEAKKTPSVSLLKCIKYVLKEEKTEQLLWIGGNCGDTVNETLCSHDRIKGTGKNYMDVRVITLLFLLRKANVTNVKPILF